MSRAVVLSANLWRLAGATPIAAHSDGSKAPKGNWRHLVDAPMSDQEFEANFVTEDPDTYGLICGNGLEMFEFEGRAIVEGWLARFETIVTDNQFVEPWARLTSGYVERTPSGGLHYIYRVLDPTGNPAAAPNTKLASRPSTPTERASDFVEKGSITKVKVMIETRGQGGFTVVAPSVDASCNIKGRGPGWVRESGAPGQVAVLTITERDKLYSLAKLLCQMPVREVNYGAIANRERLPWEGVGTGSAWDDFEMSTDWSDILEPHGWAEVHTKDPSVTRYWRRPGKDSYGNGGNKSYLVSATTGKAADRDRMYVFSTSTELEAEVPHTKGWVFTVLNHDGNKDAATRDLASQGFGARLQSYSDSGAPIIQNDWIPAISNPAPASERAEQQKHDEYEQQESQQAPGASSHPEADPIETPEEIELCYLPEEFWTSRPVFGMLRHAAWAQMASPEGVLVSAIALTLAHTMPNIALPACVGTEASLNIMTVVTAASGDGKSTCRKIAKKVLQFGAESLHEFAPGSGQGLAAQYQHLKKPKGGEPYMEPLRWNAMALVEESDRIAALASNAGNTLSSELRAAAMGELIGSGNVGDTKTNLAEGTYRFVLAMCLQPEQSAWLLDEKFGGLPQRFLFACATDARIVRGVQPPGVWKINLPLEATPDPATDTPRSYHVMGVTDAICGAIRDETVARKRASVLKRSIDEFDGHATLLRLKVAAAFALMEGRLDITDEDWSLAKNVIDRSRRTIKWIQIELAESNTRKLESVRKVKVADAKAIKVAEVETMEVSGQSKCATAVHRRLSRKGTEGETKADLRRSIRVEHREHLDIVLDALLKTGRVKFEDIMDARGEQRGSRWFWTGTE